MIRRRVTRFHRRVEYACLSFVLVAALVVTTQPATASASAATATNAAVVLTRDGGLPAPAVTGLPPGCDPADLPGGAEGPDDDGDECGIPITGNIDVPDVRKDPSSDQASSTPALAKTCSTPLFLAYEGLATEIVGAMAALGASDGATLLAHFLGPIPTGGSGTRLDYGDGSNLQRVIKATKTFQEYDDAVQRYAKMQIAAGATTVPLPKGGLLHTLEFTRGRDGLAAYLAFGGTQGIHVSGMAFPTGGHYDGMITYVISDTYGFSTKDKFFGVGPRMHYLQTTCGNPDHPGGARWFADSVTVTVPFR